MVHQTKDDLLSIHFKVKDQNDFKDHYVVDKDVVMDFLFCTFHFLTTMLLMLFINFLMEVFRDYQLIFHAKLFITEVLTL